MQDELREFYIQAIVIIAEQQVILQCRLISADILCGNRSGMQLPFKVNAHAMVQPCVRSVQQGNISE